MNKIMFIVVSLSVLCTVVLEAGYQDGSLEKAIQLFQEDKIAESKEILLSFVKQQDVHAEAAFYLGRVYLREDSLDESIFWLEKTVQLEKTDSEYHQWLGAAYGQMANRAGLLKKAGWAKKMRDTLEESIALDADNIAARFMLMQYLVQAPGFMGGSKEKAREHADEIKKRDLRQGHRAFCMIYEAEGEVELAEAEYEAFEEQSSDAPEYYQFYNDYGYFLLRQKRYEEAITKFEKQVALAQDNANAYDSLGDGYRAAGRLEEAADAYRKALEINPEFSTSKKNLKEVEKEILSRQGSQ